MTSGNDTVLKKLFNDIGPRYKDRPGGYTRILKLHHRRLGDAGETAIIELLKEGETKPKKERPTAAPAPPGRGVTGSQRPTRTPRRTPRGSRLLAPTGRPIIARGGAQRNPWNPAIPILVTPKG